EHVSDDDSEHEEHKKHHPVHAHKEHTEHSKEHHVTHEHHAHKTHESSFKPEYLLYAAVALVIILLVNSFQIGTITGDINEKIEKNEEASKPALLQLTVVTDSSCKECSSINEVVAKIKSGKVNITKEDTLDFKSEKVKEFISKYKIEKIPTVIVTGDIDKYNNPDLLKKDGFMIFAAPKPPYINTESGNVIGAVKLTLISDKDCPQCTDLNTFSAQFKQLGIAITKEDKFDVTDSKGNNLVQKYNIEKVPTLIFSSDAAAYDEFAQGFPQVGTIEKDGTFVMRTIPPPYMNVPQNKIYGLVDLTYLTDNSCTECYNVTLHNQILANPQGFNLKLQSEKYVDISSAEGKEIVKKYNITSVPTVLMSKDAGEYQLLVQTWPRVGSVESDGSFVFRDLTVMRGKYKDLVTNKLKPDAATPQQPAQATGSAQ
ncbi:MAG: hypothetical protein Q7K43_05760, partial [Candidatus Woesearchaeota archaeon]|nr:hypothetical protein [Candidatus Woesearchaeota archaeon]